MHKDKLTNAIASQQIRYKSIYVLVSQQLILYIHLCMHRIISTSVMAASLLHTSDVISHGMNNNVKRGTFILFEGVDR